MRKSGEQLPANRTDLLLLGAFPGYLVAQVLFPRETDIIRPAAAGRMLEILGRDFQGAVLKEGLEEDPENDVPRNRLYDYDVFWHATSVDAAISLALGAESLSVSADRPEDRSGLPGRLASAASKVGELFSPACCTRVGVRLACVIQEGLVPDMIRPEFIGMHSQPKHAAAFEGLDEGAMSSEAVFRMDGGLAVRGRWGQLAAGRSEAGIGAASPAGGDWMLDLDLCRSSVVPFEAEELGEAAEGLLGRLGKLVGCMAADSFREDIETHARLAGPGPGAGEDGSGGSREPAGKEATPHSALMEMHMLTRLTWREMAELFGISRQSMNNWTCCKPLSRKNQALVFRMLSAFRHLYQGGGQRTRDLLMKAGESGGKSRFELLKERRFDEAVAGVEDKDNLPRRSGRATRPEVRIPIDAQLGSISDSTRFPADGRAFEDRGPAWQRRLRAKGGNE